jgi:hypothetical protein
MDKDARIAELEQKIDTLLKLMEVKVFQAARGNCLVLSLVSPVHSRDVKQLVTALKSQIVNTLGLQGGVHVVITEPDVKISLGNVED